MSTLNIFLLVVFIAHLIPFGLLYVRRRDLKYLLLCGIFINLILSILLYEYPPTPLAVGTTTVEWGRIFRLLAWGFTASVVVYYLVHIFHPDLEGPQFRMIRKFWSSLRGEGSSR